MLWETTARKPTAVANAVASGSTSRAPRMPAAAAAQDVPHRIRMLARILGPPGPSNSRAVPTPQPDDDSVAAIIFGAAAYDPPELFPGVEEQEEDEDEYENEFEDEDEEGVDMYDMPQSSMSFTRSIYSPRGANRRRMPMEMAEDEDSYDDSDDEDEDGDGGLTEMQYSRIMSERARIEASLREDRSLPRPDLPESRRVVGIRRHNALRTQAAGSERMVEEFDLFASSRRANRRGPPDSDHSSSDRPDSSRAVSTGPTTTEGSPLHAGTDTETKPGEDEPETSASLAERLHRAASAARPVWPARDAVSPLI